MPTGEPKLSNCKPDDVFKLFKELGGFEIKESAKHTKITHKETGHVTMIPRCQRVNRFLLKCVINKYLIKTLGYKAEEIYRHLTC